MLRLSPFVVVLSLLVVMPAVAKKANASKKSSGPVVQTFTPEGTVKGVKQVSARFSESMVAFGDPRATAPFEISCAPEAKSRWVDTRNWVLEFMKDLPAGVNCEFKLKSGLKTLAGKEVGGTKEFRFTTGGPAITQTEPYEGASIAEDQTFLLKLDAETNPSSVAANVYFSIEGVQERVGVNVIEGSQKKEVLKAQRYFASPGEPVLLLQAKQRFSPKAKVTLVWGKGVASQNGGVVTTEDQVKSWEVRDVFAAEFRCERENANADCVPVAPMHLSFSTPVKLADAEKVTLKDAKGKSYPKEELKSSDGYVYGVKFKGPFPEKTAFNVSVPNGLQDDSDRPLSNAARYPLVVKTDQLPPLAKFSAEFGILEAKADPALPVTVRNLEAGVGGSMVTVQGGTLTVNTADPKAVLGWLRAVGTAQREASVFYNQAAPPNAAPKAFALPRREKPRDFEVVGIPLPQPGFYVVELASKKLGESLLESKETMYVASGALVTNLAVHFKWGIESSLVWVTALDTGKPMKAVNVEVVDCNGKSLFKGVTDVVGMAKAVGLPKKVDSCENEGGYSKYNSGVLVTAQAAGDYSFVHSSWNDGIENWRFKVPNTYGTALPVSRHTVLDRPLFRAGETVHMKHFLRRQTGGGFAAPKPDEKPKLLLLTHQGSETKYRVPLTWDAAGIAVNDWMIPKEAKLGVYEIAFINKKEDTYGERSGSFRVEEFRVPLMRGVIQPPAEEQVGVKQLPLDVAVSYLSGGGASNAAVKLRTDVQVRSAWSFPEFDDFVFAAGFVTEGRSKSRSWDENAEESEDGQPARKPYLQTLNATLDKAGTARVTVPKLPKSKTPYEVLAELEFRDPNGEVQTSARRVLVFPAKRLVGIRADSWASSKDKVKVQMAVVNLKGEPVPGTDVSVDILERKTISHRKRIVGGFYAYENFEEVTKLGKLCTGKTDAKGLLTCEGKAPASGQLIIQATISDGDGHDTSTNRDVWIAGADDWWFAANDNDRIDVLPEKKRYEPGATAKFQVRMPFREATALVTVEREGIIDTYVRELSGKSPVVELPVKGSYSPNVFVSVLVTRGRSGDVKPTALVDLGRPSYKLGIGQINVGWKAHELKVAVKPEREVYRVREKARVKIEARTADGKSPGPGAEVAIAAVDEGLLELMPNGSWNILSAMMGERGLAVDTATAQMHVVGKRHFGIKAVPTGGGGGEGSTRELFDTLLLWKARVKLDGAGNAMVEIPLNDSLTSFRIVAVANAGTGMFGDGKASIRTTQDLMIFSGIPPQARSGDQLQAGLTLRNTLAVPMEVDLSAKTDSDAVTMKPLTVTLAAGEAKETGWSVAVPNGLSSLKYTVEAKAKSGTVDRLAVTQKVLPSVPVRTFMATLAAVDPSLSFPVERPADAIPGQGGVEVALRPTLANSLAGVREYMKDYPYSCFEQETSRAVALRDRKAWDKLMRKIPSYLDAEGLLKFFPSMEWGSDTLTSYVLSISAEAGWPLPDEARDKLIAALTGFVEGRVRRYGVLPTTDLALRKLAAVEALSRYPKAAEAKLLESITIEPNLWPTSALLDWWQILRRVAAIPQGEKRKKEVATILRSRLNLQGTTMGFSTESTDSLWWLMVSVDVNSVRALLALADDDSWKEDVPRIVRGTINRQKKGHWDLTTANAWGVLAMEKFAKKFEKVPVGGTTTAVLGDKTEPTEWNAANKKEGREITFAWPDGKQELKVTHAGEGKPWAIVRARAAIPLKEPLIAGFHIDKSVTAVEQKVSGKWSRGDIARVKLKLSADADMTWVVMEDPIPSGAAILGGGFSKSNLATDGEKRTGAASPAFEERSFSAFRAYYDYVPKGEWTVEYTVRLNNVGAFPLPTTRVEAMYAPEMFAERPNTAWEVVP